MTTVQHPETDLPVLKKLRARGIWEGRQRTRLTVRQFADFATGEPAAIGGDDSAPTPMELVLAALAGCLAVVIETVATERGITVRSLELTSEATIDTRGFAGVPGVRPHFASADTRVEINLASTAAHLADLRVEVERRCPALNLFRDAGVDVRVTWVAR